MLKLFSRSFFVVALVAVFIFSPVTSHAAGLFDDLFSSVADFGMQIQETAASLFSFMPGVTPASQTAAALTPFQVDVKSHLQPYLNNSIQYPEFKLASNQFTAFVNAG